MSQHSVQIINQLFDLQQKLAEAKQIGAYERHFTRLFSLFEEDGFLVQDPTQESYNDSRTDCEASLVGNLTNNMIISKTIKPIIYQKTDNAIQLLQKAVVIVEKK